MPEAITVESSAPVETPPAPAPVDAPVAPDPDAPRAKARRVRSRKPVEVSPVDEPPIDIDAIMGGVEAIVFSIERPVASARIAEALFHPRTATSNDDDMADPDADEPKSTPREVAAVDAAVARLNAAFEASGRAFRIESIAGGWRVMTLPVHAAAVANFRRLRQSTRLSKAAVETLAIIAYKQPITRAQLEAIRGVACGEVLKSLLERRLVTIRGRAEELGRPMLYGTTKAFLDHFGLATLKDLPTPEELRPVL